jgi:hypothetical protein
MKDNRIKIKTKMKKVYKEPRISVNPLCEYVVSATASKRNSIIKQSKTPISFITKWYNKAEDILSFYLANVRDSPKILSMEANRLQTDLYTDEMERKYAHASADAINSFLKKEKSARTILSAYALETAVNENKHKFILKGVQISLRPELILRDNQGKEQLGFVKFYFSKNDLLTQERGEAMACLIKYYFEQEFAYAFKPENCLVIDVFAGEFISAPKSHKRIIANIEASCLEIADRWDKVKV